MDAKISHLSNKNFAICVCVCIYVYIYIYIYIYIYYKFISDTTLHYGYKKVSGYQLFVKYCSCLCPDMYSRLIIANHVIYVTFRLEAI